MVHTHPEITIGVLTAIAVLGIMWWRERAARKMLSVAIFGHERDNGGYTEKIEGIASKLDRIEDKLDEEAEISAQHRRHLEYEIRTNRHATSQMFGELVSEINHQSDDLDIDKPEFNAPVVPSEGDDERWRESD